MICNATSEQFLAETATGPRPPASRSISRRALLRDTDIMAERRA